MKRKLEFASHPRNLSAVRKFVGDFLAGSPFSEAETELMILGVDEACTNIIRHAYAFDESQPINLSCERLKLGVRFRLRDFGQCCDPKKLEARAIDNRKPGGLGLHLIRRAFDQARYKPRKIGTELILTKKLPTTNKSRGARRRDG
jgi:anti-sigma regulatory factor (Ser/Thr protein kinase)